MTKTMGELLASERGLRELIANSDSRSDWYASDGDEEDLLAIIDDLRRQLDNAKQYNHDVQYQKNYHNLDYPGSHYGS